MSDETNTTTLIVEDQGQQERENIAKGLMVVVLCFVVGWFLFGRETAPNPASHSASEALPSASSTLGCSQYNAEIALLAAARAQTVPMAKIGRSTSWQQAGPCSWVITGVVGWRDELSGRPIMMTFSAAVARTNRGSYDVDMFQITGSTPY